ncbi:protein STRICTOSIDINE SYNTHASE-LIKE 5-like [Gossypium australe]|uniref:Protein STRICTOSIDINE SYNTHASE-LIKE 5-like n=1 Tax=Gossypium australe TaxID=47621 RepID=A0A5B6UTL4_9ROSI|nr:protein STRICTOSIDINE SYNTHASE-LIKE 5-like [Gossypium australe]
MTSNCSGLETSCIQQLSTIISLYLIPGYLVETSRQDSKNNPSASFMMLALCTATLDDSRDDLVFEARVLAFGVLSDHHNINILMPCGQPRQFEAIDE